MSSPERRRYARWSSEGAQAILYVRGQRTQRCRIRSVSKAGVFIEVDDSLPEGIAVELAFTRSYTGQVVKMFRRSAYVARATHDGIAVLFFTKRSVFA